MTTANKPIPVIFRIHRGELTAYFPTLTHSRDGRITCYDGCHSGATADWLTKGRPANPEEYADLLAEIRRIYETDRGDGSWPIVVLRRSPSKRCQKYHRE